MKSVPESSAFVPGMESSDTATNPHGWLKYVSGVSAFPRKFVFFFFISGGRNAQVY